MRATLPLMLVLAAVAARADAPEPTDDVLPRATAPAVGAVAPDPAAVVPPDATTVALAWDRLLLDLVRRERQGPLAAARLVGIAGVAMHEAAVPASEPPIGGRLAGLPGLPSPAGSIDSALAMSAAQAHLLSSLMSQRGKDALEAIAALEARVASASHASPELTAASVAHGRAVADAVIAWIGEDGHSKMEACRFRRSKVAGAWEPTPSQFRAQPLGVCWGELRPMALRSAADVDLAAPTPYSEDPASLFHAQAMEVVDVVNRQDRSEQEIAFFWADDPGATGTPSGHWLAILDQIAAERALPLPQYLRARAALGVALHDAAIACWHAKYRLDTIRPVTYIQRHVKASWVPLISTPPFPEYPSGHATLSGAAAVVLAATLGDGRFEDRTRGERGHAPRRYASFDAAAREAGVSRLYGGIHFRPACDEGLVQGRAVGAEVLTRLGLAP